MFTDNNKLEFVELNSVDEEIGKNDKDNSGINSSDNNSLIEVSYETKNSININRLPEKYMNSHIITPQNYYSEKERRNFKFGNLKVIFLSDNKAVPKLCIGPHCNNFIFYF